MTRAGSKGASYHGAFAPNEAVLVALVNEIDSLESSPFYQAHKIYIYIR